MTKEKIVELINQRIKDSKEEIKRQEKLYETKRGYASPDYIWYEGRVKAFTEALELIGMLDKPNN